MATRSVTLRVSDSQASIAEWAINGMHDMADTESADYGEADLPAIVGTVLTVPAHDGAVEDFLYRVEEQFPDMVEDEPGATGAKSARLLAANVRHAIAELEAKS